MRQWRGSDLNRRSGVYETPEDDRTPLPRYVVDSVALVHRRAVSSICAARATARIPGERWNPDDRDDVPGQRVQHARDVGEHVQRQRGRRFLLVSFPCVDASTFPRPVKLPPRKRG